MKVSYFSNVSVVARNWNRKTQKKRLMKMKD